LINPTKTIKDYLVLIHYHNFYTVKAKFPNYYQLGKISNIFIIIAKKNYYHKEYHKKKDYHNGSF